MHSSNYDERRRKRIERQLAQARKKAEQAIKSTRRETYACEKDARAALTKLQEAFAGELWQVSGKLQAKNIYASGRVAAGQKRQVRRTDYRLNCEIKENGELIERLVARAGCFVLLSNAPEPEPEPKSHGAATSVEEASNPRTWSAAQCLRAYKEQHGVESSFSFLKEPLIVNDVFLKKPGRIAALGMVLLLSLLVWSLMQRSLRKSVQEQPECGLTDLAGRPATRPAAFILVHKFSSVTILKMGDHGRLAHSLKRDRLNYLQALGLDYRVFTTPPANSPSG